MSDNKELLYCLAVVSLILSIFIPVLLFISIPTLLYVIIDHDSESNDKINTSSNISRASSANKSDNSRADNSLNTKITEKPVAKKGRVHNFRWGVEGKDFEFGPDGKKYKSKGTPKSEITATKDGDFSKAPNYMIITVGLRERIFLLIQEAIKGASKNRNMCLFYR